MTTQEFIDAIKEMSVTDLNELVKACEEEFGVSAAAGVVVAAAGGTGVGILDLNMQWQDALNQYIMLSSGYLVLFVIPLFLTSLGFKTSKLE